MSGLDDLQRRKADSADRRVEQSGWEAPLTWLPRSTLTYVNEITTVCFPSLTGSASQLYRKPDTSL